MNAFARCLLIACAIFVIAAIVLAIKKPASPSDVVDYRITSDEAKSIASCVAISLRENIPSPF